MTDFSGYAAMFGLLPNFDDDGYPVYAESRPISPDEKLIIKAQRVGWDAARYQTAESFLAHLMRSDEDQVKAGVEAAVRFVLDALADLPPEPCEWCVGLELAT